MTIDTLAGYRVVELSTGVAGAYATKLFADAGADVIVVEPEIGSPLRRTTRSGQLPEGAPDGPLFRWLAAGKRSVVGDLTDPAVRQLARCGPRGRRRSPHGSARGGRAAAPTRATSS